MSSGADKKSFRDKKWFIWAKKILPHLIFILAAVLIVLLIVNYFNPLMNFIDNTPALCIMWALCVLCVIHFIILLL